MKRKELSRMGAILLVAVVLMWPAFLNGFPLLYPDSMSYLEAGPLVARGLATGEFHAWYTARGFWYALVIYPLHWNVTAWPILGLQGLLVSWVMWLVVRALQPAAPLAWFAGLMLSLAATTGLGWFVGFVMPDILGPVAYLAFFLLAFCRQTLVRWERWTLGVVAWWCIVSHSTHLILAGSLCLVIALVQCLQGSAWRVWGATAGRLLMVVVLAAGAQLALHARLYGEPTLNGKRPPFLLARVIADGPGRWYLRDHPPAPGTYLYERRQTLPDNVADFLWAKNGVWIAATAEQQEELRQQEGPIVWGTIKTYPGEELHIAWRQFRQQLVTYGLFNYEANSWTEEMFGTVLPGAREGYLASKEAWGSLPVVLFTRVQEWAVRISLLVLATGLVMGAWRRWRWKTETVGLAAIVLWIVIANAAVTGVLSNVEDRYQGRVIWMLPALAGILIMELLGRRSRLPAGRPEDGRPN